MLPRIATLVPRATVRYNSSTSTRAPRIANLAASVEKPSALEASVPVVWTLCWALTWAAWKRSERRGGDEVETMIVV
ncbi:hypothetical protein EKO04_009327 [Ascochyta lentis]|uniref:Uncharacterized protein n=1 Tax=Ascochyta lentis TaxID=205686 RepID=A0A8H7IXR3_9PLEO|nr:hypothetical protein EKO04_009327 [Ascochyta lentis]